jgi:hypothetical protein
LPSIDFLYGFTCGLVKRSIEAENDTEWSINTLLSNIISQERLTKYLVEAGHETDRALALYGWNIQLSESFFPVLSAAEVCLRNTLVTRLIEMYGQNWWEDPAFLLQIKNGGKRIVKTAGEKLAHTGAVTSGRMTAELNFGFWVKMLLPRHEAVFWPNLHVNFSHLPAAVSYERLYKRCDDVREFRNRIFHHEPILHKNITAEYSQILELIKWLSPDKATWIKTYSRVMTVVRQKP